MSKVTSVQRVDQLKSWLEWREKTNGKPRKPKRIFNEQSYEGREKR
jgi:hypothetical protein